MTENKSTAIIRFRRVMSLLLMVVMVLSSVPVATADSQTGVTTAKVILRKSADTDSKALQTLPEGEEVDIVGSSGSWYKVRYGQFSGYIMQKYVKAGASASSSSSASSSKKSSSGSSTREKIAALGDAPGPMRIGDTGDYVVKLQKALTILGYFKDKVDGDYGELTTAAVKAYQMAKKLDADGIAGPSTVKAIFGSMGPDLRDQTTNTSGTTTTTAAVVNTMGIHTMNGIDSISDIGAAPSTCREGDVSADVVKLQQALTLLGYYSGTIDGSFGSGTLSAVKRFQRNRGLKQDGVAGSGTIRVLFNTGDQVTSTTTASSSGSTSSASYVTEVPDWFNGGANLIPNHARFTIKDVRTGRTFEAVRWSGVNHLDAEPRNSDATATMKAIFGGSWSWNRRPILILYNGHVYAASMNGMPHGTTTIDNGFEGHFCIHFKNSKTHGTKRVDEDHQKAVTQASKATW